MDSSDLKKFLVVDDAPLHSVLGKLDETGCRTVFVVDDNGRLLGSISDGDIRRGLMRGLDIDALASEVMNVDCISFGEQVSLDIARQQLESLLAIPIIDASRKIIQILSVGGDNWIPAAAPDLSGNELRYVIELRR